MTLGLDGAVQINVVLPSGNAHSNANVNADAGCEQTLT